MNIHVMCSLDDFVVILAPGARKYLYYRNVYVICFVKIQM